MQHMNMRWLPALWIIILGGCMTAGATGTATPAPAPPPEETSEVLVEARSDVPARAQREADTPRPRILMMIADGFNHNEFTQPFAALRAAGYLVDVAAPRRGNIESGNRGRPDAIANLTLDEVRPELYVSLVIPGGYSPARLGEYPRALELARWFMERDRPVGAICHGPRLLLQAELLDGRPMTALWSVKEEMAELWKARRFGGYLDQPVVIDGKLLTGRHVADLGVFVPELLAHLARHGGLGVITEPVHILAIAPGLDDHRRWELTHGARDAGLRITLAGTVAELEDVDGDGRFAGVVIGGDGESLAGMGDAEALKAAVERWTANRPVHAHIQSAAWLARQGVSIEGWMRSDRLPLDLAGDIALTAAQRAVPALARDERFDAVIVVEEGFDDHNALAMRGMLLARGHGVGIVGPKPGKWVRGVSGVPLQVDASWDDVKLTDNAIIVAPGAAWPVLAEGEGNTVDRARRTPRYQWLLEQHEAGRSLILFGYDSLVVGRDERFRGKQFASSRQAVWAFGRNAGAGFNNAGALRSDTRLITARDSDSIAEVARLLEEIVLDRAPAADRD
ncbi:MAG: DJ-1/PfpI family protein [Phycisphaeraceae bacterium]|nr:DJ-1/PfpI family protein [Phycisphaeraceae bacterium]